MGPSLTKGFVSSLRGVSGQLLQEEHEQFPPLLHAGVEERLIANLTLVAQALGGVDDVMGVVLYGTFMEMMM